MSTGKKRITPEEAALLAEIGRLLARGCLRLQTQKKSQASAQK